MAGFGGGPKAAFGEDTYGAMLARLDQLPYTAPLDLKALLNRFPQSQVWHSIRMIRHANASAVQAYACQSPIQRSR